MIAKSLLFSVALLLAAPASAVTYTYTGQNYDTLTGSALHPACANAIDYTCRGGYSSDMRATAEFTLAEELAANANVWLDAVDFISMTMFDGINRFTNANGSNLMYANLITDSLGMITEWTLFAHSSGIPDFDEIRISSSKGDEATFRREFSFGNCDAAVDWQMCIATEAPSALASGLGTWAKSLPAVNALASANVFVTPLPASLPLLAGALALLGWRARRAARA